MSTDNKKAPAGDDSESLGHNDDHQQVYPAVPAGVNDGSFERIGRALDMVMTRPTCADCGEPSSVGIRVAYRKDEDAILCDIDYASRRYEHMNRLERVTGHE